MITVPDRIGAAIAAMEEGAQVDWRKLAALQALDLARAGQQFAQEAVASDAAADDLLQQLAQKALSQ